MIKEFLRKRIRVLRSCPGEEFIKALMIILCLLFLTISVFMPLTELLKSSMHATELLRNTEGNLESRTFFCGAGNYVKYFTEKRLFTSFVNSLWVSAAASLIATGAAFCYAYAVQRTCMKMKNIFRALAMLPLFAPTMLFGLSLVYLFGRKGLITTGFSGTIPGFDIGLYGATGIIIAETFFVFPPAFLVLSVALANVDGRLYDAAKSFGVSRLRKFLTVTMPGIRYGLLSALIISFTLSFTDFGAAKIVGGNFNVLAVDIYKQVAGQQNFGMGATVSIILLIPSMLCFIFEQMLKKRQYAALSARSTVYVPEKDPKRDWSFFIFCLFCAIAILLSVGAGAYASLVKMWPYDFSLSLRHYDFNGTGCRGNPFTNSIIIALLTAGAGTILVFLNAYAVEKIRGFTTLRQALHILAVTPLALPGLVIGISYIFFFNSREISLGFCQISNPFCSLYGTIWILVLSNIVHFYTVGYLTATASLKQLDKEFESVSESMAVPFWLNLTRVVIPLSIPALIEICVYFFVSSMATVSALIFLYTADTVPAAVAIVNMDDAGDQAQAAAMCILIVGVNIIAKSFSETGQFLVRRKYSSWSRAS